MLKIPHVFFNKGYFVNLHLPIYNCKGTIDCLNKIHINKIYKNICILTKKSENYKINKEFPNILYKSNKDLVLQCKT